MLHCKARSHGLWYEGVITLLTQTDMREGRNGSLAGTRTGLMLPKSCSSHGGQA